MDEAQLILQALYATRGHTDADRKKIDRAWADYSVARSRGQKMRFGELVVRRGILTAVELRSLLQGERRALGSDAAVIAASGAGQAPPGQQSFNIRAAIALVGAAALVSAAFVVNVGGGKTGPSGDPSGSDPVVAEASRLAEFSEHLENAARARVAGDVTEARSELARAERLVRSKDEQEKVDAERAHLPSNLDSDGGAAAAIAQAQELDQAGKLDEAEALLRRWVNSHLQEELPQEKDVREALSRVRKKQKPTAPDGPAPPSGPEIRGTDPSPAARPSPRGPTDPLAVEDQKPSPRPGRPAPSASPPAPEPEPEPDARALASDERPAAEAASDELVQLARFCIKNTAFREARSELESALAILPGSTAAREEIGHLGDASAEPSRFFRDNWARESKNAHMRAANKLADLAMTLRGAGDRERHDRWVETIQQCFPGEVTEKALTRIGLAHFAPYLQWVDADDARRLEAGGELIDGNWLDREAVADQNLLHSTWDNPWILSDEAHELRTNLTVRNARRLLSQAGAFRRYFLRTFSRQWRLKQPLTKLPIILTKTREDYLAQLEAEGKRRGIRIPEPQGAAAFYISLKPVGPIFVTIEPAMMDGSTMKSSYDLLMQILKHELTHQIAREYSAFDCLNPSVPEQFWCIEGLAECLAFYQNDRGHWHLTHPARTPSREAGVFFTSAWGYVERNLEALPKLDQFFSFDQGRYYKAASACYPQGASVVDFMLHGEHGRYRRSFVRLCEAVHKGKIQPTTFEECFPGIDVERLNRQWRRFVRSTGLEDE